jgi:hypothetical protein
LDDEAIPMAQKTLNSEQGAGVNAQPPNDREHSNSVAPQQVVRRHGSAKPLVSL